MNTRKRQTLHREKASRVITMFVGLANDDRSIESTVFPTRCKRFEVIPSSST